MLAVAARRRFDEATGSWGVTANLGKSAPGRASNRRGAWILNLGGRATRCKRALPLPLRAASCLAAGGPPHPLWRGAVRRGHLRPRRQYDHRRGGQLCGEQRGGDGEERSPAVVWSQQLGAVGCGRCCGALWLRGGVGGLACVGLADTPRAAPVRASTTTAIAHPPETRSPPSYMQHASNDSKFH